MATTPEQVEAMRAMCKALETNPLVKEATVDDWGRHGNFSILVTPREHDRHTTGRLKALIRRTLPKDARLREIFGPDPIKDHNRWTGKTKIVGYTRNFWSVDIDYQPYHLESNSFGEAYKALRA